MLTLFCIISDVLVFQFLTIRMKASLPPPKTILKKSKTGYGLFAAEPIAKGRFIIEYIGPILDNKAADKKGGRYLFRLDRKRTIDGSVRWNRARYINHSCVPNCEAINEGDRIMIYAKKNIAAGEELFYNYGKEYFDEFLKGVCLCAKCVSDRQTQAIV